MRKVKDILREANGPQSTDRSKFCKCTGPWDCQCTDVLDKFYDAVKEKAFAGITPGLLDKSIKFPKRKPKP